MALPTTLVALRMSMVFTLLLICCLALFVANSSAENLDNKLAEIDSEFDSKHIAKRQANEPATTVVASSAPAGESSAPPVTTKKPKKKKKNKDKKKKKAKKTTASPPRNFTDILRIGSDSPATRMTLIESKEEMENMTLLFEPKTVSVFEGKMINLTITYANLRTPLLIKLKNMDPSIFEILSNDTFRLMPIRGGGNATKTITIKGKNLGITGLAVIVIEPQKRPPSEPTFVHIIKTLRIPRKIDMIFDYSILPLVIVATTGMGCKMEWTLIKSQLRRPFPISVGPLCQFILMPFFSFAIAKMVKLDPLTAFGLLIVGSCPGGGLSNMISLLIKADLIQSVVMTFCSTLLAVGMLPFNLWLYARAFAPDNGGDSDQRMGLPLGKILMQIMMLMVPLITGIIIRHKLPKVAYYLLKPLNGLSAFLVTTTLGVGIYSNAYVISSPWEVLLSAALLPVFGFSTGFAIARFVARLPTRSAMTVCIETGIQNNLIAISMLKLSFPQPEADLMARSPVFVAIASVSIGIGMIVASIPINRRAAKKSADTKDADHHSVDGKVDTEPESPEPYSRYEYKPIPYEKAIAMNGGTESKKTGGSEYTTLNNEQEIDKKMVEDLDEDPLYVKMRKTSTETDV